MSLPLAGIRVLDLSRLLPGGFCSLLLADFGAEVLKVEDTGMGDYIRWAPPYYEGAEDSAKSALFLSLNRNKRSIRIDLKSEQGRELLLRLVQDYDVVLESFRPGVLDRLGVGYEQMRAVNPGIVYCAISGYGQSGPKRDAAGHDMNYLALVGLLGLTGEGDGAGGRGRHPVRRADRRHRRRCPDGAPSASSPRCVSATAQGRTGRAPERARSSMSRWPTVRSRGLRWSPDATSPSRSCRGAAALSSRVARLLSAV